MRYGNRDRLSGHTGGEIYHFKLLNYLYLTIMWWERTSAAEFRKYCKRLHVGMYTKRKHLHAKYSIVHIVYLPCDNVWCLTAMGQKTMSDNRII